MSQTVIYAFDSHGDAYRTEHEFDNAHGSAAFVWDVLCDSYNVRAIESAMFPGLPPTGTENWMALFEWEKSPNSDVLLPFERTTLFTTYDNAVARHADLLDIADAMEKFVHRHRGRINWPVIEYIHTDNTKTEGPRGTESMSGSPNFRDRHCPCPRDADGRPKHKIVAQAYAGRVCHIDKQAAALRELHKDQVPFVGWYQMSVSQNPWDVYVPEDEDSRPYNLNQDTKHHFIEVAR